ncbi:MAG TPA: aminotransferase class I/II-fold pyridoxal phosphate-dependent enzyme, partial [Sphingomonas sp.]|nr:aminotransferase class I/II-fold pyridoxal phosphate-dependent enzyme [Sphingomonas sp.]
AEAAAFFGSEAALFLSSGYVANSALLSTLPQSGDHIFYDALIHASAHEGMRLARCGGTEVPHNDAEGFERAIARWRAAGGDGRPWIAVESLYSMDGDRAPLEALAAIADRHEAFLLIDEAHATGVFGEGGRGLAAGLEGRENVIVLRTLGKALGCEGALICCAGVLRDFLVNRARGFIFSTAPSPLMAAVARAAIAIAADADDRRAALRALWTYAAERLVDHGAQATGTQIMPLILADDGLTMAVAGKLQAAGLDVRGIRPPTVAPGTARLRISLTLNVGQADIDALDAALAQALA